MTGAEAIHQPFYIQASDPGAVGAWKVWIDITDPAAPAFNYRNATDDAWVAFDPSPDAHEHSGADITSGTVAAARIDNLPAAQITSGVLAMARLATGTPDGTQFVRDDGTLQVPAGGGGGGGGEFVDAAPASPSAYDDEFTTASLDAKWTEIAAPDASFTKYNNRESTFLSMKGDGHATNVWGIRQAMSKAAGVAVQVTIKAHMSSYVGDSSIRLAIQNVSAVESGSRQRAYLIETAGQLQAATWDGANNPTLNLGSFNGTVYLHLQRNTANLVNVYVSRDGVSFRRYSSITHAWNIEYLFLSLLGSAVAGQPSAQWVDWIRVDDARFTQAM